MARIILHRLAGAKKALDACRLVEKLYLAGRRVAVWLADERKAQLFDQYLWTFADESFVPHALATGPDVMEEPVVLITGPLRRTPGAEVLVLLDVPPNLQAVKDFDEAHDFITTAPDDVGRAEAWRSAGFEVTEVRGVEGPR